MRILAVETHHRINGELRTSSVDWWRIVNPFTHLQKNTNWDITIRKGFTGQDTYSSMDELSKDFLKIKSEFDLVVSSYHTEPYISVYMDTLGIPHVCDIDDDFVNLEIAKYNPATFEMKKDVNRYAYLLTNAEFATAITTTNRKLLKVLRAFYGNKHKSYAAIQNAIDFEVYSHEGRTHEGIVIGYQGGSTHFGDLAETPFYDAIEYVLRKYNGMVRFELVGQSYDEIMKLPYTTHRKGSNDFYKWVDIWKTLSWDITIAPLEYTDYNSRKSPIKAMEAGAMSVPIVTYEQAPYDEIIEHGINGYKARTTKEWINALESLIQNKDKRVKMGRNLNKTVREKYNIKRNYKEWERYLLTLKELL